MGEPVHRVDTVVASRPEHRLDGHPADEGRRQRLLHDRADVAVVHAERSGHHQRGEDAGLAEPGDRRLLEPGQVGTPVEGGRRHGGPVVLKVDLQPVPVAPQQREQVVVLREQQTVGVHHDPHDRALDELGQQFGELRVERRLAPGEHQHVDPVLLAGEAGVHVGEHVDQGCHPGERGTGGREAGRAPQVAVLGDVLDQDAGVLGVERGQPVRECLGHRTVVVDPVGYVHLCRRLPLLQVAQDVGVLVVQRPNQAVDRAGTLQPHSLVPDRQDAGQPLHAFQRCVGRVALRAVRGHVLVDPVAAQGLAGPQRPGPDGRVQQVRHRLPRASHRPYTLLNWASIATQSPPTIRIAAPRPIRMPAPVRVVRGIAASTMPPTSRTIGT